MMSVTIVCLWALVIALGIQLGAGIFETRVLVPLWAADPPASVSAYFTQQRRPDSGKRLWMILTPVTAIISLLNLVLAFSSAESWRLWWLVAASCSVAVMVATFAYFVPVLRYLERVAAVPPEAVAGKVRTWVVLNYLRAAVLVVAWIAALRAFAYAA